MCFLVILGLLMGWLSPPDPAYRQAGDKPRDIPTTHSDSESYLGAQGIPEFYLRPELIPVKGDGLPAVAEAERVVRSRR